MEKRPAGKRLLRETDYALLKRVLCGASSLICLDVDDLTVLQKGGAAFLLESPPCASMDELIRLAPLAAAEMAPELGICDSKTWMDYAAQSSGRFPKTRIFDSAAAITEKLVSCWPLLPQRGLSRREHHDLCDVGHSRPL